jgi:hypothetical protein
VALVRGEKVYLIPSLCFQVATSLGKDFTMVNRDKLSKVRPHMILDPADRYRKVK